MDHHIPTPREPAYWDREALTEEEKRVFLICNGCRLCWNLCPSFPTLFDAVDALDEEDEVILDSQKPEGEHVAEVREGVKGQLEALEQLPQSLYDEVADLCWQCKLCDPICPYTPPHEHAVDFPRLMLRHKAIHAKEHGVSLQDRFLGDPDMVGRLGTLLPSVANWGATNSLNRVMMEKTVGIHRDRQLPPFADETFRSWFERTHPNQPPPEQVEGRKVVLFYTCSVQWNEPQVGRAAVEVLEHNDVTVYAPEFRCCGMPALDGGDVARATSWAEQNVEVLKPYVDAGCEIVCPGPTCSFMIREEWKEYLGTPESESVSEVGYDLMQYLHLMRKKKELKEDYQNEMGDIGYHVPCHLRVQKIGYRSRDVMKRIPGTSVKLVDRCACMDGTWGMKTEYYEISKKWATKTVDEMTEGTPDRLSTDCLIAKLQIEEMTGRSAYHPIEIVREAYGDAIDNNASDTED